MTIFVAINSDFVKCQKIKDLVLKSKTSFALAKKYIILDILLNQMCSIHIDNGSLTAQQDKIELPRKEQLSF